MKRTLMAVMAALFVLLVSGSAFADVPAVVPVQGILNDANGDAVDGSQAVTFTFYDQDGNSLWSETFALDVDNGFFSVGLGDGANTLDLEVFATATSVELGIKVGTDDEMTPRMQVGSVPYAAKSQWSESAMDADALEGQSLADLDARYVEAGEAGSVTTAMIANDSINTAKVANPVALYAVTNLYCEQEPGTLMNKDWCYARQDDVSTCAACSGTTSIPVRNCDGTCGCATRTFCIVGQPCNPRRAWPQCQNQPVDGYALPPGRTIQPL